MKIRHYEPKAPDAPAALRRCADMGSASAVTLQGDLGILDKRLLGFFCSVRCPGDVILKTYDLARALRETDVTIVGGFQSPMEKECLALLLRGSASVVVCPARGLDNMRLPKSWKKPLADGRLLLLSCFSPALTTSSVAPPQPLPPSVTLMSPLSPPVFSSPTPKRAARPRSYARMRWPKANRCLP